MLDPLGSELYQTLPSFQRDRMHLRDPYESKENTGFNTNASEKGSLDSKKKLLLKEKTW